jgi:hypothetical protein
MSRNVTALCSNVSRFALVLLCAYATAHAWAQSQPQPPDTAQKTTQYDFRTPGQVELAAQPLSHAGRPPSDPKTLTVSSLLQNGTLYLTLQDAIDLAVENNFDIEIQRFVRQFALTDLLGRRVAVPYAT